LKLLFKKKIIFQHQRFTSQVDNRTWVALVLDLPSGEWNYNN